MLGKIFRQYKARILATYTVMVVELTVCSLEPYLIGKAVDGLLRHQPRWFWIYLGLRTADLLIGFVRRRLDTRVFMRIVTGNVTEAVRRFLSQGIDPSRVISRSAFVRNFGDFFEYTLPATIQTFLEMAVSVVILWLSMPLTAFGVIAALAVIGVLVSFAAARRMQALEQRLQDQREKIDTAIMREDVEEVCQEYDRLRVCSVQRSDTEAYAWGVNDILTLAASVFALFVVITAGQSVGTILSVMSYTTKLFWRCGFIIVFFHQIRQIEIANNFLKVDDESEEKSDPQPVPFASSRT